VRSPAFSNCYPVCLLPVLLWTLIREKRSKSKRETTHLPLGVYHSPLRSKSFRQGSLLTEKQDASSLPFIPPTPAQICYPSLDYSPVAFLFRCKIHFLQPLRNFALIPSRCWFILFSPRILGFVFSCSAPRVEERTNETSRGRTASIAS
jgi:hypothetical protein